MLRIVIQSFLIPLQKILTSEKKKVSETSEILGVRETVFEPFIILHEDQGARSTKYMYCENVFTWKFSIPFSIVISVMQLTLTMTFIACMAAWVNGMVVRLLHPLLKQNTN